MTNEVKLFQHPEYSRMFADWQIYKELYQGDESIIRSTKYTPMFVVEETEPGKKAYQARLNRTFYTNLLEPIISTWLGWLFSKPPNFEAVKDVFDGDETNIDGFGTSLREFLYQMGIPYLLFGKAYLSVETPNVQSNSRPEDRLVGLRPYARIWNALEVPDWIDETENFQNYGNLKQIDLQYSSLLPRSSNRDKPREALMRRSLFLDGGRVATHYYRSKEESDLDKRDKSKQQTLYQINQLESDWIFEREGQIDIDEIPVITLGQGSWIADVVPELRRRHILVCSYENILHYQAYKKTFISGEPLKDGPINMAENAVIWLKQDSTVTESSAEDPTALEKRIADVTDTIFKIAFNTLRQVPGTSKQVQSDSTIREEKEPQIAAAKTAITDLEVAANDMVRLWAKYKNKEYNPENQIVFNKDFTLQDVESLLSQYSILKDRIAKAPSWERYLLKKVAAGQEYSPEQMKEIEADLEKIKPEAEQQQIGAPGIRSRLQSAVNGE